MNVFSKSSLVAAGAAAVAAACWSAGHGAPLQMPEVPPFEAPDAETRRFAIGDISSLGAVWRALLEPHGADFSPMAEPAGSDWLKRRQEQGQTFRRFALTKRNVVTPHRRVVYLAPFSGGGGLVDGAEAGVEMESLRRFVSEYFQLPAKVLAAVSLDSLHVEYRTGGRGQAQVSAPGLLDRLEEGVPGDAFAVVGITAVDLFGDPRWAYQFGMARPAKRVAVISYGRFLSPVFPGVGEAPDDVVLGRSCKVLAHEVGHLLGINHCIYFRCVMNGSNHLAEADARPLHLCPVCLRKAGSSVRFQPLRRYRNLQAFYRGAGFHPEAEWVDRRIFRGENRSPRPEKTNP